MVKNPPASAGDLRDTGPIPGSGRPPGGGHGNNSSILIWRIPWTEGPGALQSWGHKELDTTEVTTHACTYTHGGSSVTFEMAILVQRMSKEAIQ